MATIGVMTTEFDLHSLDDVADSVTAHRLSSVQLQLGSAVNSIPTATALLGGLDALGEAITEDLARRCRTVFDARGIEIAAVDGTYNMVHLDPRRRQRNLGHLIKLINLASTFGTRIVTLCTGSRDDIMWRPHPDNQSKAAWRDLLNELEAAAAAAEAAGVVLAFEPEHNNVVNSAQRARQLIDDLGSPALKVLTQWSGISCPSRLRGRLQSTAAARDARLYDAVIVGSPVYFDVGIERRCVSSKPKPAPDLRSDPPGCSRAVRAVSASTPSRRGLLARLGASEPPSVSPRR